MNYQEAVTVLLEETGKEHDGRCFEVGECDVGEQTAEAYKKIDGEAAGRKMRVSRAARVILDHLERYDAEHSG